MITCRCGSVVKEENLYNHFHTLKHLNFHNINGKVKCGCGSMIGISGWKRHCKTSLKHIKVELIDPSINENDEAMNLYVHMYGY